MKQRDLAALEVERIPRIAGKCCDGKPLVADGRALGVSSVIQTSPLPLPQQTGGRECLIRAVRWQPSSSFPFAHQPRFNKSSARGGVLWHIQGIERGEGPVNLDNYRVKILELPSRRGLDSLTGLLSYVRLNINRFVDPARARMSPYSAADAGRWHSTNPVGAVMHWGLGRSLGPLGDLEGGSVLCSSYSDTHWIFSTVHRQTIPSRQRHRQFGFYTFGGNRTFYGGSFIYTRAADRVSPSPFNAQLSGTIFGGGHQTWMSFQRRLASYVNEVGGKAAIVAPYSTRYPWAEFRKRHKPTVDWVYKDSPGHGKGEADVLSPRGGPI